MAPRGRASINGCAYRCYPGKCRASVGFCCAAWPMANRRIRFAMRRAVRNWRRWYGWRWTVEECFETAKGEGGLDQYEVRRWHVWWWHIILAMTGYPFQAVLCTSTKEIDYSKKGCRSGGESGNSSGYRHRLDGTVNQKTAVPTVMAVPAGCEGGDSLVPMASASSSRRLFLSLLA